MPRAACAVAKDKESAMSLPETVFGMSAATYRCHALASSYATTDWARIVELWVRASCSPASATSPRRSNGPAAAGRGLPGVERPNSISRLSRGR
jgi:hypothetical protein